jgi:predicted nucleic acid-binding protein
MEWLKKLRGTIVGLDTAPLIYFIENHPKYAPLVRPFFEAMERGEFQVVTSALTLTEVLVHPLRRGDKTLARKYSRILRQAPNLQMLPVSWEIAEEAARLRAIEGLKTPDAIQLATARAGDASSFLTNDTGLRAPAGLRLIVLESLQASPLS